jgi:hypothetical protein
MKKPSSILLWQCGLHVARPGSACNWTIFNMSGSYGDSKDGPRASFRVPPRASAEVDGCQPSTDNGRPDLCEGGCHLSTEAALRAARSGVLW